MPLRATLLTACLLAATLAAQEPSPGDAPDNPGPLATLPADLNPTHVRAAMRTVAGWQSARLDHNIQSSQFSQDWTWATLYRGLLAASQSLHDPRYARQVRTVAQHYQWSLGPRQTHADDQAIGQSYLWLYARDRKPAELAPMRRQFDTVLRIPDDPQAPVWWWCDALFMAPPVWAQLTADTHNPAYLAYMDREWHITSNLLWDPEQHLFFRDKSYFDKREKNGAKVFWSRGNGWVFAGLAQLLDTLPANDPRRAFYEEKFRDMAAKLLQIQSPDGLWRPGLLDAASYPYPEISGSSFFVYGMAWGVRLGLLPRAQYAPAIARGWQGLVAHIYADGRLGSIQPIGAAPGAYTPSSSYVFGVGAFLMAGSEVAQLRTAPAAARHAAGPAQHTSSGKKPQ